MLVAACGGGADGPTQPAPQPVVTVTVTPDAQSITVGQTLQFNASLRDASGAATTGSTVVWSATPATVGTVSGTGLVTALAPGALTVTATSGGRSGSAQLSVISNAPVATITVESATLTLIPLATTQLTAVLKDGAGNRLTGRPVVWTATPASVGSVSSSGLVTAVTMGTLTVTATSEGRSANTSLTVASGAMVGPTGGTFSLSGGDVEIVVPAGAVSGPIMLTSRPVSQPAVAAPAGWQTVGQQYAIGPAGTMFAQPVTVTFRFKSSELPAFAMSGDLALRQASAGQWSSLSNVVVNAASKTISGRTTSFGAASSLVARTVFGGEVLGRGVPGIGSVGALSPSAGLAAADEPTVGVSAQDPTVSLSPPSGSVNAQQRSVTLVAALTPRGAGVPLPAGSPPLTYRWTTTGRNGALSGPNPTQWTTNTSMQYTATNAVLNQLSGPIDQVTVEVLLNPGETDLAKQRIASATATIDADLAFSYDILPASPVIAPSEATPLRLVIRDKQGAVQALPPAQSLAWSTSGVFGTIGTPGPRDESVIFRAYGTFSNPPPRVDDVLVQVKESRSTVTRFFRLGLGNSEGVWDDTTITRIVDVAQKKAFVEVKVNYQVSITPAAKQLTVGSNTPLTVNVSPAYDGPGLMYKWTNPGAFGTLNVANGARTTSPSVTYTATANGGVDRVRVDVVSVVAGVELETLGTAYTDIEVDSRKLAWRFTNFELLSYTYRSPIVCVDLCRELVRLETTPGAGFIFAFPDASPNPLNPPDPQLPVPGVHLMTTPYYSGDGIVDYGRIAGYQLDVLVHRFNGTLPSFPNYRPATGTFVYTGDARSGTISGVASPVLTSAIWDSRNTLVAEKSGEELTGTLKIEHWEWLNPSVIISTKVWRFRAQRLP